MKTKKKSPPPRLSLRAQRRALRWAKRKAVSPRTRRRRAKYETLSLAAKPKRARLTYEERLVAAAKAIAARAIAPNLKTLLDQLAKAESLPDARKRALAAFPKMDTKPLAKAVARMNVLAALSGRLSAQKQT